ncbi:MAG TPA: hypothetical protein VGL66_04765 [Caulobacteraceae bacterium]|jgi:hypothetical protein
MSRQSLALLLLASLLAGPALACPARNPAGDEKTVRALETQWIGSHDRATLDRILADDFRHPVFTGDVLSKRQHIDWAVAHPASRWQAVSAQETDIRPAPPK